MRRVLKSWTERRWASRGGGGLTMLHNPCTRGHVVSDSFFRAAVPLLWNQSVWRVVIEENNSISPGKAKGRISVHGGTKRRPNIDGKHPNQLCTPIILKGKVGEDSKSINTKPVKTRARINQAPYGKGIPTRNVDRTVPYRATLSTLAGANWIASTFNLSVSVHGSKICGCLLRRQQSQQIGNLNVVRTVVMLDEDSPPNLCIVQHREVRETLYENWRSPSKQNEKPSGSSVAVGVSGWEGAGKGETNATDMRHLLQKRNQYEVVEQYDDWNHLFWMPMEWPVLLVPRLDDNLRNGVVVGPGIQILTWFSTRGSICGETFAMEDESTTRTTELSDSGVGKASHISTAFQRLEACKGWLKILRAKLTMSPVPPSALGMPCLVVRDVNLTDVPLEPQGREMEEGRAGAADAAASGFDYGKS
ncbi:hypothetical protein BKA70DRAFT_1408279 [Coprinopsis sp. MPI-PUGE-AT-0042]|nr:hypothetical protein BKA70DRAFT_1408279 [Coprinopsis sp. MPI-PUGE-AT-0042]